MRNILLVLWTGYPIVWILAAGGIKVIGGAWSAFLYMVLDLTAKGSFGLILTNASSTTLAKASNYKRQIKAAKSYVKGDRK